MQPRILVADDQADILSALKLLLKREGFDVATASSPAGVLDIVAREHVDVALVDLNYSRDTTSGEEGVALVEQLHREHPDLPVIVMTAWATVEVAVKAMRNGANDFLEKPWNNQRLLSVLRNQVQLAEARQRGRRLADENAILRASDGTTSIATSRPMQEVVRLARQVARSDASVLITGEPGTGKSLLAKLMHDWSDRAEKSFISVNAGGLPETVFESEMFGHVKGAFTDAKADRAGRFELADGGTLFLDEIGNVPPPQQARLLRALETGEFERVGSSRTQRADVRVVSATNADLPAMIRDGRFREDLLFRINTVEIRLPPLRERREEILELANAQLAQQGGAVRARGEGLRRRCARGAAALRLAGERARAQQRRRAQPPARGRRRDRRCGPAPVGGEVRAAVARGHEPRGCRARADPVARSSATAAACRRRRRRSASRAAPCTGGSRSWD